MLQKLLLTVLILFLTIAKPGNQLSKRQQINHPNVEQEVTNSISEKQ